MSGCDVETSADMWTGMLLLDLFGLSYSAQLPQSVSFDRRCSWDPVAVSTWSLL